MSTLLACDKEKKSRRNIHGGWSITSYKEIIFDGTTEQFTLNSGSANFGIDKNNEVGTVNITWNADNSTDTSVFDFVGECEQISLKELQFTAPNQLHDCRIDRQLKKDMIIEMVVNPNRKSVLVLKKD